MYSSLKFSSNSPSNRWSITRFRPYTKISWALQNIFNNIIFTTFFASPESVLPTTAPLTVLRIKWETMILLSAALISLWLNHFNIKTVLTSIKTTPGSVIFYILQGLKKLTIFSSVKFINQILTRSAQVSSNFSSASASCISHWHIWC